MAMVLIAGGATGIGRAALDMFLAAGDHVPLADIDATPGQAACHATAPERAVFCHADLSGADAARATVAAILAAFGGLDTLVVNAAVLHQTPSAGWTEADRARSLAVIPSAPFFLVQAAAPALRRSGNASVILTSSTGALRGHARMHAFHATETALPGLTRSLADELSPNGIRVNENCPGLSTPRSTPRSGPRKTTLPRPPQRLPARQQGTPADVAGVIVFLASPAAAYVAGAQIVVDGGYSAV